MSFGGSLDCGSVERDNDQDNIPWKVVVNSSRGKRDMRPVKIVPRFSNQCCHPGKICQHVGSICSIEREHGGNICGIEQYRGAWERVPVTVDSGAIDSVIPARVASAVPVRETEASKRGLKYRAANGTSIVNKGERKLQGYTNEANLVNMSMQVCEVTKPLGSVRAMLQAGNCVVFDKGGSYIMNKASGVKTAIEDRNGAFVFDIWVPRGNEQKGSGYQGKYFQALQEKEE